ncbi:hypothetical protein ACFLU5_04715 [Bacteroidota bacterium]
MIGRIQFLIVKVVLVAIIVINLTPLIAQSSKQEKLVRKIEKKLKKWDPGLHHWQHVGTIMLDSISVEQQEQTILLFFSKPLSYLPVREETLTGLILSLQDALGNPFKNYKIEIFTDDQLLEELIPNIFREEMTLDSTRFTPPKIKPISLVRKANHQEALDGLHNRHIALWHSHGWYYESKLDRWEWQRARLHSTVEDVFPITFVLPYLVPMLENAGAYVFLPRERDIQINEVIVDNDNSTGSSIIEVDKLKLDTVSNIGFQWKDTLKAGDNPFKSGSYLRFRTTDLENGLLKYIPAIPENGDYAVYVSYSSGDENVSDVRYSVVHSGGKTDYFVNQQMGAGTWIYLGTFHFKEGLNPEHGCVLVSSESSETGWITSDAIRFGGGMGNVARRPSSELMANQRSLKELQDEIPEEVQIDPDKFHYKLSKKPRYAEAARYYLQYAGIPDTLVFSLNEEKNDYNDDYQSRGEWVNYLMGNPNGPTTNREVEGLGIPIDLSLAFHTDAGVTPNDSIIGTLGIYSSVRDDGVFPNGQSKKISRDLSDIIQTQLVNDIRTIHDPDWTRRGLWNRQYSEAWRPNVPSMLLELLSHQNLADMRWGLDPRFKFTISRAIYKGILKFLAFQENRDYVVQPLPVDHFAIQKIDNQLVRLSWIPTSDPLEPSAKPTMYKVYTRNGDNGFDNGNIVWDTVMIFPISKMDQIYSFKVTALNAGGESFPSEILSTGFSSNSDKIALIVNAFDRICGPAIVDNSDIAGVAWWEDQGIPYKYEIGYTGAPYDFNRQSLWLDDDSPGWGASYGDLEDKVIPGNTFDFSYTHGEAILEAGYSYISISDESFCRLDFDPTRYDLVDIIFGEEKTTPSIKNTKQVNFELYTTEMRDQLDKISGDGGNIFISGANVGSDFIITGDTITMDFASDVLHYTWRTNHAVKNGGIYATDYAKGILEGEWEFNTDYHHDIYRVESPDALEPSGDGAITALRYSENNASAGVVYKGNYKSVILGFPFETIIDKQPRFDLMRQIINFFNNQ